MSKRTLEERVDALERKLLNAETVMAMLPKPALPLHAEAARVVECAVAWMADPVARTLSVAERDLARAVADYKRTLR
jgi:hypothetical protein